MVRLREDFSPRDRDAVLEDLRATGIECRNYFSPIHPQPFYRQKFGFGQGDFPVAEQVSERIIVLPFFGQLPDDDILTVCDALACAIRRQKRIYAWTAAN